MGKHERITLALIAAVAISVASMAWIECTGPASAPEHGQEGLRATPGVSRASGTTVATGDERDTTGHRDPVEGDRGWYRAPIGRALTFRCEAGVDAATVGRDGTRVQSQRLEFEGPLQVVVIGRQQNELTLSLRLSGADVEFEVGGRPIPELGDRLARSLDRHWFVRMTTDGATVGVQLPIGVSPEDAGWLRAIVVATRCVFVTDDARSWRHVENDTEGAAVFSYRLSRADCFRLQIERSRLAREPGRTELPMEGSARGEFVYDRQLGWIRRSNWREHTRVDLADLGAHAEVKWSCSTDLRDVADLPRAQLAVADPDRWATVSTPAADRRDLAQRRELAHWQAVLRGVAVEQLLADLLGVALAGDVDDAKLRVLVEKLGWHLRLDPDGVAVVLDASLRHVDRDLARESLFAALGASQQPAAQDALVSVLSDLKMPMEVREGATRSLFQVERPGADLIRQVIRHAGFGDPAARSALLLVGAFGDGSDRHAARQATDWLLEQEQRAIRQNRLPEWIASLGNQRTARATEALLRYVAHEDPAVRERVVIAIADRSGGEVERVLRERVTREPNTETMMRLARAAIQRDLLDATRVRQLCVEHVRKVRLASLEALAARQVPPRSPVYQAARRMAASEADRDLRQAARRVVKRHSAPR